MLLLLLLLMMMMMMLSISRAYGSMDLSAH